MNIRKLNQTSIIVEHNGRFTQFCDNVYLMKDGVLKEQ